MRAVVEMEDIRGNFFVKNDKILGTADFNPHFMQTGKSVYEVIRIVSGIPLFIQEHLDRLSKSVHISNQSLILSEKVMMDRIHALVEQCALENGNIKLTLHYNDLNSDAAVDFYAFFIRHYYPTALEYLTGVDTITYHTMRSNPNAKVANLELNARVGREIKKQQVFEAILLDDNDYITEGSRSNIFMIETNTIYTAPLHNVLPGITRSKVLEICHQQNYAVVEKNLRPADLNQMEAVFLTGTSPNVLPIRRIDGLSFPSISNPLLKNIMIQYDAMIVDYVQQYLYPCS